MVLIDHLDPDNNYYNTTTDCSYYDVLPFKNKFKANSSTSLLVFHLNARSIRNKLDELLVYLKSLAVKFHVLVLTESWLTDTDLSLNVPGYTAYHSFRKNRKGGGVSVLVDEELNSELLPKYSIVNDLFEMCSVRVNVNKQPYNILGVYRPPDKSCVDFNRIFFELIDVNEITDSFSIFLGDFNINLLPSNLPDATETYVSEFRSLHFLPYISLPTHVNDNSLSLIDHIWINSLTPCKSGVFPIQISDHFPIFISVPNIFLKKSETRRCEFRCHDEKSIEHFKVSTRELLNDFYIHADLPVDIRWSKLCQLLLSAYKKCCPIKVKNVSVKRLNNPWMSDDLHAFINRKHELDRLSRTDSSLIKLYKYYRNLTPIKICTAKRDYFKLKFERCTGDIKKTWNSINKILRPNVERNIISEVLVGDERISDPLLLPQYFNDHYTTVANKLAIKIPHSNVDPTELVENSCNSFVYFPTDCHEIKSIIMSFKSKGGNINSIPNFMFKHVASEISPLLSDLINESFAKGSFPDVLKIARVIPIFKAGQKDVISNYRPISTLPFLTKIFERVVSVRLTNFFLRFGILSEQQFGFRKGRSTVDAVLRYTDEVYEALNYGQSVVSVLLDLSKAFDTVDHQILINKLNKIGIRGISLQWIKSYLTNRVQYVEINGKKSTEQPITIGVPQGSILGPLLFLIYINDMSKCSEKLSFVHFADDTTVFIRGASVAGIVPALNAELQKVDSWLCSNKLSLNLEKTVYMVHTNKLDSYNSRVTIRNTDICKVDSAKFLGIIVDDKLKFKNHVSEICSKMSKTCGVLRRLASIVPSQVLRSIYLSLVYPYIVYGVEVWGDCCKTKLNRLCSIQDRCVKLLGSNIPGSLENKYTLLGLLPYENVYEYFTILKIFQYFILQKSNHFQNRILSCQVPHQINTRFKSQNCLNLPFYHLSSCQSAFLYNSITLWNKTPIYLREVFSYDIFKKNLKLLYLEKISAI